MPRRWRRRAGPGRTGPRPAAQRADAAPGGPERGAFRCDAAGWSEVHGKAFETGLRIDPKTGIDVRNERCSRLKTFEASFVRPIDRTTLPRIHLTMPDPNKSGGEEGPTIGFFRQSVGIPNRRNPTIENIGVSAVLPNRSGVPIGGSTGLCHQSSAAIDEAAAWYSANRDSCPRPVLPEICARFGLTTKEACGALAIASGRRA